MRQLKLHASAIATIALWASAFVGIRVALQDYSPGTLALLRFIVASICMFFLYKNQQNAPRSMPWKDKIGLMLAGVIGMGIYNICLNYGEIHVSAGIASFIIGLMPIITIIFAAFFLEERLNKGMGLGVFVSLLGLAILALGEGKQTDVLQGILLVFVSTVVGAILTIVQKRFLDRYSAITVMAWVMWGGTLLLLIYLPQLLIEFPEASSARTLVVIYLGIFPAAIAYVLWSYVLKHVSSGRASTLMYALPLTSMFLGFLLLHEQPTWLSVLGGSIALLGAYIANIFRDESLNEGAKV